MINTDTSSPSTPASGESLDQLHFHNDPEMTHRQITSLLSQGRITELELVCKHTLVRNRFDAMAWFYLAIALIFFQKDGDFEEKRTEGLNYLYHAGQMNFQDALATLKAIERHQSHPDFFAITPETFSYFLRDFNVKNSNYNLHPARIFIETQAICNARCHFCTYDRIERKGAKMTDALLSTLLDSMKQIPGKFYINFNGINEPFADKRILDLYEMVNRDIPQAFLIVVTNGSLLTPERQSRLFSLNRISLSISLNEADAKSYEEAMNLSFAKVIANLDRLHDHRKAGHFSFPVSLSRVNDNSPADEKFRQFVEDRYPLFKCETIDKVDLNTIFTQKSPAPLIPCLRWYTQMVLATGDMALCCDDHHGGILKEDANKKSLLEIYNGARHRAYRDSFSVRDCVPCRTCATACPFKSDNLST